MLTPWTFLYQMSQDPLLAYLLDLCTVYSVGAILRRLKGQGTECCPSTQVSIPFSMEWEDLLSLPSGALDRWEVIWLGLPPYSGHKGQREQAGGKIAWRASILPKQ